LLSGGKLTADVVAGNGWPEPWKVADELMISHIELAKRQQHADGSLSSNFFRNSKSEEDLNRCLQSGYVLEFLVNAVSDEELAQPWLRKAVEATARRIVEGKKESVHCGPYYHSTAAIRMYLQRSTELYQAQGQHQLQPVNVAFRNALRAKYEDDLMWLDPYPELGRIPDRYGGEAPSRLLVQLAAHPPAQTEMQLPRDTKLALRRRYRLFAAGKLGKERLGTFPHRDRYWEGATATVQELLSPEQFARLIESLRQRHQHDGIQTYRSATHRESMLQYHTEQDPDVPEEVHVMKTDKMIWDMESRDVSAEELAEFKRIRGVKAAIPTP
jgi:hypothetical protein